MRDPILTVREIQQLDEYSGRLEVLYEHYNWTWRDNPEPPKRDEIRRSIFRMMKDLKEGGEDGALATGGLTVSYNEGHFEVSFAKEECLFL